MRRYRAHLLAIGIVTAWALLAYGDLGVEVGSSGLTPLGWVHAAFFFPGVWLFRAVKGSYSNADLPLIALIGWALYALALFTLIQLFSVRCRKGPAPQARRS
jgi:hypothetical protein